MVALDRTGMAFLKITDIGGVMRVKSQNTDQTISIRTAYSLMFTAYPDIVSIKQMREMLGGIGKKEAYRLLHENHIPYRRDGKGFKIMKIHIIKYMLDSNEGIR